MVMDALALAPNSSLATHDVPHLRGNTAPILGSAPGALERDAQIGIHLASVAAEAGSLVVRCRAHLDLHQRQKWWGEGNAAGYRDLVSPLVAELAGHHEWHGMRDRVGRYFLGSEEFLFQRLAITIVVIDERSPRFLLEGRRNSSHLVLPEEVELVLQRWERVAAGRRGHEEGDEDERRDVEEASTHNSVPFVLGGEFSALSYPHRVDRIRSLQLADEIALRSGFRQ